MPCMETLELATTVYRDYAAVYDRSGQMRFSVLMDMYLREVLLHHPSPGRRMLDLACGTGTLALMQAEASWDVTGLDLAAPMLEEARRKQQTAGIQASFVQGDMRDFELAQPVDLVTCCYDSLNYLLSEEELLSCFRSIYRSLVPGGLCCFDLATEYFLRHYWQGVEVHEADGYSEMMASSFDDATGRSTLVLTGCIQAGLGRYHRFREVHVERSYAPVDVERLLRHAGLVPKSLYDCFTFQAPNAQSLRHFWVARKGTGDRDESCRLPITDLSPPTSNP